MSDLVAAPSLNLQPFITTFKFSTNSSSSRSQWPQMLLPTFNGNKWAVLLLCQHFLAQKTFPTFPWPWRVFSPVYFLTCGYPAEGWCTYPTPNISNERTGWRIALKLFYRWRLTITLPSMNICERKAQVAAGDHMQTCGHLAQFQSVLEGTADCSSPTLPRDYNHWCR